MAPGTWPKSTGTSLASALQNWAQGWSRHCFGATSVGVVVGARLADERRVAREGASAAGGSRRVGGGTLRSVAFTAKGFLLRSRWSGLTLTRQRSGGCGGDGHPGVSSGIRTRRTCGSRWRRLSAAQLEIAKACAPEPTLERGWNLYGGAAGLWPREAHAPMFDFDSTAVGAEWIDALATEVKPLDARTIGAPDRPHGLERQALPVRRRGRGRHLRLGQHQGSQRSSDRRQCSHDVHDELRPRRRAAHPIARRRCTPSSTTTAARAQHP